MIVSGTWQTRSWRGWRQSHKNNFKKYFCGTVDILVLSFGDFYNDFSNLNLSDTESEALMNKLVKIPVKIIFLPLIALITPVILLAKAATHVSCYVIGPALLVSVILAVVFGINRDWLGIGLCAGVNAVMLIVLFGTAWLIANMEDAKENMIGFLHS